MLQPSLTNKNERSDVLELFTWSQHHPVLQEALFFYLFVSFPWRSFTGTFRSQQSGVLTCYSCSGTVDTSGSLDYYEFWKYWDPCLGDSVIWGSLAHSGPPGDSLLLARAVKPASLSRGLGQTLAKSIFETLQRNLHETCVKPGCTAQDPFAYFIQAQERPVAQKFNLVLMMWDKRILDKAYWVYRKKSIWKPPLHSHFDKLKMVTPKNLKSGN